METPDEIKKGLECCAAGFYENICAACPYSSLVMAECPTKLKADALALIQQLEADNAQQARCIENLTDKLNALNDALPRWISVEERLPGDDCDWVLAIGKFVPENIYGKPIISELRKDGKWWGDINDEFPLEDMGIRITHWMPLPSTEGIK